MAKGAASGICHFGIRCRLPEQDLKLNKQNFIYKTGRGNYLFKDRWLKHDQSKWDAHRRDCLNNYDLSMAYFRHLSQQEFSESLEGILRRFPQMESVHDLNDYDGKPGVYMLVLDEYKQVYVGKTISKRGIKGRIVRHWRTYMPFDRILSGDAHESIMSIDSFRTLDTTRIFAAVTKDPDELEYDLVCAIPVRFSANRTKAGFLEGGLSEAIKCRRKRALI